MNMKLFVSVAALAGLASALSTPVEVRRSQSLTKNSVQVGTTSEFTISTMEPTEELSAETLSRIETLSRRDVLTKLRGRQFSASDFYECRSSSPAPSESDCQSVISNVYGLSTTLTVTARSCLTFSFGTCQGFFCSLCQQLSTSTDFVGSELDTANDLCVSGGQAGTVVGDSAPQWSAGFVYAGRSLPTYNDVC
ncbi:hypothetical protein F4780DRAFT_405904 [Xylariomycetidae sp. FL0641]|nr:hypothetical protein F4780DRAFT_405904 [Xylariomycetidae sp. FL0641]